MPRSLAQVVDTQAQVVDTTLELAEVAGRETAERRRRQGGERAERPLSASVVHGRARQLRWAAQRLVGRAAHHPPRTVRELEARDGHHRTRVPLQHRLSNPKKQTLIVGLLTLNYQQ